MRTLFALLLFLFLTGCSGTELIQYQNNTPTLSLFDYFDGKTRGYGIVQDRNGKLTRQFVVDIVGTIEGSTITLDEDFIWSDGEESRRVWTIVKQDKHTFTGTAADVVGTASGEVYGNVLNLQYHLNLTIDDSTYKVHMDDWMFLQQDSVLINKTSMSKFGIHLADVTITFVKNTSDGAAL